MTPVNVPIFFQRSFPKLGIKPQNGQVLRACTACWFYRYKWHSFTAGSLLFFFFVMIFFLEDYIEKEKIYSVYYIYRLDPKCKAKGSFTHWFQQTSNQILTARRGTRNISYPVIIRHQKYFLSSWTALITHHSYELTSALATAVICS